MKQAILRFCLPLLLWQGIGLLLSGCDRSIDHQLATLAAAEKSLGMSPTLFATRFNRTLIEVLGEREDTDAAHMAPLYAIDVTALAKRGDLGVFQTEVGPSGTAIMGSYARDGELKTVGVLLTQAGEGARADFYLCVETMSRVFIDAGREKLPELARRLVQNALDNPGQRMSAVIGDKVLSADIVQSGLLFQIERQQ